MSMKIMEDKRLISSITTEGGAFKMVGRDGVKSIAPYEENGEMAPVLWFAVQHKDGSTVKLNGKYVVGVCQK